MISDPEMRKMPPETDAPRKRWHGLYHAELIYSLDRFQDKIPPTKITPKKKIYIYIFFSFLFL